MTAHRVLQDLAKSTELDLLDPGDAGTIELDRSMGVCSVVTAASETRKIGSPQRTGVIVTVCLKTDGGDLAITGAGGEILNSGSGTETTATMADAGDVLTLISVSKGANIVWAILANHGAALS
tara:strand:- start:1965 stop:2333 length:369 start_codon:yes stop_codon:yes gene_type:complete